VKPTGNVEVKGHVRYTSPTVTFDPENSLAKGLYRVTVTEVADKAGNVMPNHTWTFATRVHRRGRQQVEAVPTLRSILVNRSAKNGNLGPSCPASYTSCPTSAPWSFNVSKMSFKSMWCPCWSLSYPRVLDALKPILTPLPGSSVLDIVFKAGKMWQRERTTPASKASTKSKSV
jgi:Bacterial Ig-like domain